MEAQPGDEDQAVSIEQRVKAQEFKNSGNDKFNKSNYRGAIAEYLKGLVHEPNNSDIHANLSAAYLHLEKYIQAEEHALYAIHLRPNFHKGYMRAAKADHGKGMTRLALKRLAQGLSNVTDPIGIKELNRLKTQYTSYLSLQSNSERELEFDSDTYQSEDDEDEGLSTDDDSSDDQPPPHFRGYVVPDQVGVTDGSSEAPDHIGDSCIEVGEQQPEESSTVGVNKPEEPNKPEESNKLEEANNPEESIKLEELNKPDEPNKPEESNILKELNKLDEPNKPEESNILKELNKPDEPNKPEESNKLEELNKLDEPNEPEETNKIEELNKLDLLNKHEELNTPVEQTEQIENKTDQVHVESDDSKVSTDPKTSESQEETTPYDRSTDKKPEHPLDWLTELSRTSEMKKNIGDFKDNLKAGGQAYLSGNYRKAADHYKAAYEGVGKRYFDFETDERQCNVIRYASYTAMINLNTYDDIIKGIHGLNDMTKFGFDFPAIYLQIARAYYKLNRFKTALEPLDKLHEIIGSFPIFPTFTWPGTNETMEETTPNGLKNSIKELNQLCRMTHKATAVCRFDNCLKTSSHILPSELIFSNDPDFIGYVRMLCEEKCHIEFHISCWKSYKESICGIGKINDKDFLGRCCLTTDCINSEGRPSIITTIEIIGADGQVKSVNRLDPKANAEQKAAEKKAKKKRSKLDDKEKVTKSKKLKEKVKRVKPKEKKQSQILQGDVNDEDDENEPPRLIKTAEDYLKTMERRKEAAVELRKVKFGINEKCYFDPRYSFYGNSEESMKASNNQYVDQSSDTIEVKDAKDFVFSYFFTILKDEGALKLTEVEDLWKESAGDFCDITVVLPNLKSMCDLLMESTRFCQIEDRLCLAEQLEETYKTVRNETVEHVDHVMPGSSNSAQQLEEAASSSAESDSENESDNNNSDNNNTDINDSDDSEDEGSDRDEIDDREGYMSPATFSATFCMPSYRATAEPVKPPSGKPSLQDDLTSAMNILKIGEEEGDTSTLSDNDSNKDQPEELNSNETFETAHGSSANTTSEDLKTNNASQSPNSVSSNDDSRETIASDHVSSEDIVVPSSKFTCDKSPKYAHDENVGKEPKTGVAAANANGAEEAFNSSERDKGSQSVIPTEERHIQTAPTETKDRLSQTKESDLYKELNRKVQELNNQLASVNREKLTLMRELNSEKQVNKAQQDALLRLHEENRKNVEAHKDIQERMRMELTKQEEEYKRKEYSWTKSMNSMKEMYTSVLQENGALKSEKNSLINDTLAIKQSLAAATANIKEIEKKYKALDGNSKGRIQKALLAQLALINNCWKTQFNLHKKRYAEKITEIQSWFSESVGDVESLPSYPLIQENISQWVEMVKQLPIIEAEFQAKYKEIEKKIEQGSDIDDLQPEMIPAMPKEPAIPPLEMVHKEIVEKHAKANRELMQLVATQQLQIEKSREQAEQLTQYLMHSLGSKAVGTPRLPQPITTAFGGLALQYPFPGTAQAQFPGAAMPPVPPTSQDGSKIGNALKLPDIQNLLQDSSKIFSPSTQAQASLLSPLMKGEARSQTPPVSNAYSFPPPMMAPPPSQPHPAMVPQPAGAVSGAAMSMPPPLMGVAQSLLQNSSILNEQKKDIKPSLEQRARTPKLEQKMGSSRESTPGPASTPAAPTPEKSKKKKKTKSGEAAAAEARIAATFSMEPVPAVEDDSSGWNVVLPKSAMPKHVVQPSGPSIEGRSKNKKKLLDNLQTRFPTTSLKDLEDIVKQVRENNNGSLSGLPFDEIEVRVERILTKRHVQKNSTMGLVKFSDAAWGTVKPQEIKTFSNVQLEECTICLEPMGNDRTKVDCNHEFHTKCLRKWLKEKSVCPLCNKFTTMPDEFPAL